jgi:phage FluMu gp28-like protein
LKAIRERSTNVILSANQQLSSEVLAKARGHLNVLRRLGYKGAATVLNNATTIELVGGGRIKALPANPRTARSFTGNVYFDEYAYHQDPEGTWDAAAAMATRGGWKIRVVSTPNGAQGKFYELATNVPKGWGYGHVSIEQAMAQGMRVNLQKLWEAAGHDERVFAQWYRCAFLDGDMQYIPTAMVDRALNWKGEIPALDFGELYAGLDVGRTNDLTVLTVIAVVNGVAYVIAVMTCKRTNFRSQKKMIRDAHRMFQWQSLHIDATGLGSQMAEELVEEFGEDEATPLAFTADVKDDLATRALRWFRDDRVRFPRGDEGKALHRETVAVRRIVTNSGNITYDVPRTSMGHGDRWWALCLALRGAGEPQSPRGMGQEPLLAVA